MKLKLTIKHTSVWMKSFLKYFALKIILLNLLQNVSIYLFKCFLLILIIPQNDTFLMIVDEK